MLNSSKIFNINFLFIISLLTLSFKIINIFNYSVTFSTFIIFFIYYKYILKNNKYIFYFYLLFIVYFISILFFFIESIDFIEFVKSFLLSSIMLLVYLSSMHRPILINYNKDYVIKITSLLIILFSILQILEFLIIGSSNSWFFFKEISISTAEDINRFEAVNFLKFIRPISFYHEPSYLGVILLILLICSYEISLNIVYRIFIIFGILLSFSTTALMFLILLFFFNLVKSIKKIIILIIISVLILFSFYDQFIEFLRFNEIMSAGTSGNARLIGPFDYLLSEIIYKRHYFGIPLGQSDLIFDNSFYLIFLYFGLLAPLIYILFIFFIFYKLKSKATNYLIAVFALLFLNGAIFTIESAFLLFFLNTFFFLPKKYNISHSLL